MLFRRAQIKFLRSRNSLWLSAFTSCVTNANLNGVCANITADVNDIALYADHTVNQPLV